MTRTNHTPKILCFLLFAAFFCLPKFVFAQDDAKPFGSSLEKYKKTKNKAKTAAALKTDDNIIIRTDLVLNDVYVRDAAGRAVRNLKADDFIVTEDGTAQDIAAFSFGENSNLPHSIVFILDYSGNVTAYTKSSIDAAKAFVEKLSPNDKMAIVTDDVRIVTEFTSDKTRLKNGLDGLLNRSNLSSDGGRGEQYSSLLAVINEKFTDERTRPVIIFQTTGGELLLMKPIDEKLRRQFRERDFSFGDVRAAIENSRVTIYSIVPGLRLIDVSDAERENNIRKMLKITSKNTWSGRDYSEDYIERHLKWYRHEMPAAQKSVVEIAEMSGGYADFLETGADAEKVYAKIFEVMKERYVIGYYPTNEARDGKQRTVKIEVKNHPEYKITGRKTYIAPTGD